MSDRRPIASRNARIIQGVARWLAATRVTPNQISQSSILFAAIAGGLLWASAEASPAMSAALLIAGALAVQLRLLANLFDGLVAVEGGKSAADGAFWNEVPDRLADLLILAGAGMAVGNLALGLAAGACAVLTAYIREFARAEGTPPDFSGPMAKPQRMATITIGAVAAAIEVALAGTDYVLLFALVVITLGALLTALLRARRIIAFLQSRD